MNNQEILKVEDKNGFIYEVSLQHRPHLGYSSAFYKGNLIEVIQLGRILQPTGDDDREWEMYEERYSEWTDEIKVNIIPICKNYFNKKGT